MACMALVKDREVSMATLDNIKKLTFFDCLVSQCLLSSEASRQVLQQFFIPGFTW